MRFKRVVLSCFTALSLLCVGAHTQSIAAEGISLSGGSEGYEAYNKDTIKKIPENISGLLHALGLMDESETDSEEYVKRGAAAEIVLRFDKLSAGGTATGEIYVDVSAETSYAYEIEAATRAGYFLGGSNGKFDPDDNITPMQMATVLLRLAGYRDDYIASSSEISKLLKNAGGSEYLTYYDLAYMLYDFLDTYIVEISSVHSGGFDYKKSRTETILNNCFDVYKFKGVITENSITGLWSGSDIGKNCVTLSGDYESLVIDRGETNIDSVMGRYVEAYYKYVKNDDPSVCIYYSVLDKRNKITEIDLYDIDYASSTESRIEYYPDGNKKYHADYDKKTAILYNGTYYADTKPVLEKLTGKDGKITVIDNNNDGTADVLDVEAFDTYIVNSVILSTGEVFLKNTDQKLLLDKDFYDRFDVIDENGNDAFIEDFVDGTVLSVAENTDGANKKVIKVLISEQKISGIVTQAYKGDFGRDMIQLDNINDYVLLNNVIPPAIGQGVVVKLNALGHVAMIDYSNSGEFVYGIITRVWENEDDESVVIKMITAKNTIEKFEIRDKLVVDKTSYSDMSKLYKVLHNEDNLSVGEYKFPTGVYPVRYRLREDGALTEIDTSTVGANENSNTFELLASGKYSEKGRVMGGVFAIKDSTPVFRIRGMTSSHVVKSEFFDDTRCTAMSDVGSIISSGGIYHCAAYQLDKDSVYADFLVIYSGWGGYEYADKILVIDKIDKVYDEATEQELSSIRGISYGFEKNLIVSDRYEEDFESIGLVSGDAIRYSTDIYDHLIDIENDMAVVKHTKNDGGDIDGMEFNNIDKGRTALDNFKDDTYSVQMVYGYVLERRDDFVKLAVIPVGTKIDGARTAEAMDKETVLVKIPSSVPITVYDPSKSKEVYIATYDEIKDYAHNGEDCSVLALHFRSQNLLEVLVYNDAELYK